MPIQTQPFDFGNTLKQQNLRDRQFTLEELALGKHIERQDRQERRLEQNQIAEAQRLLPIAIVEAAEAAKRAPEGKRADTFRSLVAPVLQRSEAEGIAQPGTLRFFDDLNDDDFFGDDGTFYPLAIARRDQLPQKRKS